MSIRIPSNKIATSETVGANPFINNFFGSKRTSIVFFTNAFLAFTEIFPFELIAYLAGAPRYYDYRSFRLIRTRMYLAYWNDIMMALHELKVLLSRPIQRFFFLTLTMGVIAHVFACGWYGMAVNVMKKGFSQSWLATDGLAYLDSDGELVITNSVSYRYLRAIYWAVQTLDTVGFGDVVAHSESETWYCILFFFVTAYLVYSSIANLMTIVSDLDANKMKSITTLSRYNSYASTRKLSSELTQRVKSYYQYQLGHAQGFDEQEIIASLPSNIQQQVHHELVRKLLLNVELFRNYNKGLLNALSEVMESYVFSPGDVIVASSTQISGAFFVSHGEVELCNLNGGVIEVLGEGKAFGLDALRKSYITTQSYCTKSYSELYYLRGSAYRYTLELYKEKLHERGNSSRATPGLLKQHHSENIQVTRLNFKRLARWGSLKESIESLPKRDSWRLFYEELTDQILKPQSKFREWWNNCIFFALLFYLSSGALLLTGILHSQFLNHYFALLTVSYIVDFFFVLDIIFQACCFQVYDEGILLVTTKEIYSYFLKTHNLFFLSCWLIPYDVIIGFGVDRKLLPICRLLKLLHMHRFFLVADECIESLSRFFNVNFSFEFIRFIALYLLLFELCHWAGCLWLLAADLSTKYYQFNVSWKWNDISQLNGLAADYDAFYGVGYTRSIYWAASVMSSIGFPDILPTNPVEYVVIILVMFFGYLMFNTLLGAIATMIGNFNREKREFNQKVERIRDVMEFTLLPTAIEARTIRYYEYLWARYEGVNESEVLKSLPRTLRSDAVHQVVGPLLHKIPFFQSCSEPLEHFILDMFESRVFLHGDALMIAGDIGSDMFIIEKGNVVVTSADRSIVYARLSSGDYAGESSLLESRPRAASVFAVGYVDTYFVTNEKFEKVGEKFSTEYYTILNSISETIAEKKQKNETLTANSRGADRNSKAPGDDDDNNEVNLNRFDLLPEDPENRVSLLVPVQDKAEIRAERTELNISRVRKSQLQQFQAHLRYLRYIVPYNSYYRLLWDNLIVAILLYFVVVSPLRISFVLPVWLYYIDYTCDVVNIIDAYLHFNHFSVNALGMTLLKPKDIRQHYLEYRFFVDLFVNLPYDLLAFIVIAVDQEGMFWFVRAILRLPKVFKLFFLFGTYHQQVERASVMLKVNAVVYKVMELTLSLVLLGLWVACAWTLLAEVRNKSCQGRVNGFNCHYVGTWIQGPYTTGRIAANGSGQWTRLIRAFNFAIPNLTGETMGEVLSMNEMESLFAFFVIFCGLAINGAIIGFIVALVRDANSEITELYRKKEQIRSFLKLHQISDNLITAVEGYFTYLLTSEGSLVMSREKVFADLPHSLKIEIDTCLKTIPYLRRCPFFDFCTDEVLRKIAAKLNLQLYTRHDKIIQEGDLGNEMFFLESGRVNVISGDGKVVYATLEEGSFFGETALFFKTPRGASIQVISPFCVCLSLNKYDLDNELRSLQYDEEEVLQIFKSLQQSNQRRNEAVSRNLTFAKQTKHKLHQLIPLEEEEQVCHAPIVRLRKEWFAPNSVFRMVWDVLGLIFLIYYIFSIPLFIAFLESEKLQENTLYIVFEVAVDIYWLLDVVGKACFFSYQLDYISKKVVTDGELIWSRYRNGNFLMDLVCSVPIEILTAVPALARSYYLPIYMSRACHLIRVLQINHYVDAVEEHVKSCFNVTIHRTTSLLLKAGFAYIVLNHWMSCIYFIIHRYAEIHFPMTYVIADQLAQYDPVTGRHNICSSRVTHCYARSIYFVLQTMTSIGYGDIIPYTNNEAIWQVVVAILGAYIAAIFMTFMQTFQMDSDARHFTNYQLKLHEIEQFCKFRKLSSNLAEMITMQFQYQYYINQNYHRPDDNQPDNGLSFLAEVKGKQRSYNRGQGNMNTNVMSVQYRKEDVLALLSKPLQLEIYSQLYGDVVRMIPIFRDANRIIKRRLASKLKTQFVLENHCIYSAGDLGKEIFFVLTGEVEVHVNKDISTLDGFGLMSLPLLFYKQLAHSVYYNSGDHFGECCLLSKSGLRPDTATASLPSEICYIEKEDLWEIFLYTPIEHRREFIHELFTRIHEQKYIPHDLSPVVENDNEHEEGASEEKIVRLFKLAVEVMREVAETLPTLDEMLDAFTQSGDKASVLPLRRKKKSVIGQRLSNADNDNEKLNKRSFRQLAKTAIKINRDAKLNSTPANSDHPADGPKSALRNLANSVLNITNLKTGTNKVQDELSSDELPEEDLNAIQAHNAEVLEAEEEAIQRKENEELMAFIQQHQFQSNHNQVIQQYQDKAIDIKSMRRTFSAESITQRKREAEEVYLQHEGGDKYREINGSLPNKLSLEAKPCSQSKSHDWEDRLSNEISSFRSTGDDDGRDEDDTLSEGISDLFSNNGSDSALSTISDSKRELPSISEISKITKKVQFDESYLGLEDVVDDFVDNEDDVRIKSNIQIREEEKVDQFLSCDQVFPTSEAITFPNSPDFTPVGNKKRNQDLLTSSTASKVKKTQRNQVTSLSSAITPNTVRRGRRHSSFIPNISGKLPLSPLNTDTDNITSPMTTFFDFPMNSIEVMEIFGPMLKSPQTKLQPKHHFHYNYKNNGNNIQQYNSNEPKPNGSQVANKAEQVNGSIDTKTFRKDDMDITNLNLTNSSKLRRRSTYPEHVFLSNQSKMNEIKDQLSQQIQEQFRK